MNGRIPGSILRIAPDDAWMLNRAFGATYAETTESRGLYFSLIGGSLIGGATFSAGAGGSAG
jgi:hypothetical protein